jgi:hypothetical protein
MEQDLRGQGPSSTSKIRNPGAAKGLNHTELGHGGTTFQRLRGKQFAITVGCMTILVSLTGVLSTAILIIKIL